VSLTAGLALVFVLAGASAALADGRIEGRVTRPGGAGFGGVTVILNETAEMTITDGEGRFVFAGVAPGTFSVTFALGGNTLTAETITVNENRVTLEQVLDWNVGYAETVTVYAASRRIERLIEAPASVAVVNEVTIAREAPHAQLPKVLESAAGVELAQSGVFDFNVNIRGLNSALNRRVLTLVDGRDPSGVLIGAQEWAAFALPIDEIARVEIVRGAGSALYGVNAFNGVVDITSKEPRYAPGGQVEVSGGEVGTARLSARYAGAVSDTVFYRAHTAYGRTNDFFRARNQTVEYPGLPTEVIAPPRDRTEFVNVGARIDRYLSIDSLVTVEGGWARSEGNLFLTSAGRLQNLGAQRPWVRSALQTARWRISGYYDGRRGSMASLPSSMTIFDDSMKASAEVVHRRDYASGSGRLVAGAMYRYQHADTQDDAGVSTILRGVHRAHDESVFGQLDHPLGDRLKAVLAVRVDESTLHDPEISPKAGLVYSTAAGHAVRFTYGRAFEAGSFVHYFTRTAAAPPIALGAVESGLAPVLGGIPLNLSSVPVLALGNEQLEVERVQTFETGYSGVLARRVVLGANYYFNRITNLITPLLPQVGTELGRINPAFGPYRPPSTLSAAQQSIVLGTLAGRLPAAVFATMSNDLDGSPIFAVRSYTNYAKADIQGVEVSAQYFAGDRVIAEAGYSAVDFMPKVNVSEDLVSANAPAHRVTAGLTFTQDRVTAAARVRWSDRFTWNGGVFRGPVPAATLVDLTVRGTMRPGTVVLLNVANLLDNDHYEVFGGDILRRRALVTLVQSW
jgi:iron complex outermembrane receptor protein